MRANQRLKTILTWTIMSIVGLTAVPAPIMGGDLPQGVFKAEAYYKAAKASTNKQLACLARNVYYEAGNESFKGQLAVAQVTVNRMRSGKFPNDICKVVSQSKTVGNQRVCQFSWYCDPTRNKNLIISKTNSAYIAAKQVLLEGRRLSTITWDTFFFHRHDIEVNPVWPRKFVAQIGDHVFYRPVPAAKR